LNSYLWCSFSADTYKLTYGFFGLCDGPGATTYTRGISKTPFAGQTVRKVGPCPTSACSNFFSKLDALNPHIGYRPYAIW